MKLRLALHLTLFLIALLNLGRAFFYLNETAAIAIWLAFTVLALVKCARVYKALQT